MGMIYTLICKDGTKYVGDQTKTCANNGGTLSSSGGTINWENIAKEFNKNKGFPDNSNIKYTPEPVRSKPVLCNDGTYDVQAQEPYNGMGRVAMVCYNKGGIAKNQPTPSTTQGNNTKEPIYYILVTAGVLIAGYFAYKKFIK